MNRSDEEFVTDIQQMISDMHREDAIRDYELNRISEELTGVPYDLLEEVLDQCAYQQAIDEINKRYAHSLSK